MEQKSVCTMPIFQYKKNYKYMFNTIWWDKSECKFDKFTGNICLLYTVASKIIRLIKKNFILHVTFLIFDEFCQAISTLGSERVGESVVFE